MFLLILSFCVSIAPAQPHGRQDGRLSRRLARPEGLMIIEGRRDSFSVSFASFITATYPARRDGLAAGSLRTSLAGSRRDHCLEACRLR